MFSRHGANIISFAMKQCMTGRYGIVRRSAYPNHSIYHCGEMRLDCIMTAALVCQRESEDRASEDRG